VAKDYNIEYIPFTVLTDREGKILHIDNPLPEKGLIEKSLAEN